MDLKVCPTCKTMVFADMDTCYGCMYRFGSDPEREAAVRRELEDIAFPEDEGSRDGAESGSANANPLEAKIAIPWPPPAEAEGRERGASSLAKGAFDRAEGVASEVVSGNSVAVFEVPALTISVKAASPLPAGVTLRINLEPPSGEMVLVGG